MLLQTVFSKNDRHRRYKIEIFHDIKPRLVLLLYQLGAVVAIRPMDYVTIEDESEGGIASVKIKGLRLIQYVTLCLQIDARGGHTMNNKFYNCTK